MERIPVTREGYEVLKKELEKLKRVERPQNIKAIEEARAHGDLSENAEFAAAKDRQGFIEGRISELEYKLANADVIEPDKWFFVCLTADGKEAVGYVAGEDGKVKIPPSGEGNPKALAAPYLTESGLPIEIGVAKLANGTTDGFFDGIIDEVYLWDRALSEDEIAQLAQGTRPNFSNLVEPGGKLSTLWGIIKSQNR